MREYRGLLFFFTPGVHVCRGERGQRISLHIGDGEDVSSGVTQQPSLHIKIVSREEAGGRIERWARDRKEDRDAVGEGKRTTMGGVPSPLSVISQNWQTVFERGRKRCEETIVTNGSLHKEQEVEKWRRGARNNNVSLPAN